MSNKIVDLSGPILALNGEALESMAKQVAFVLANSQAENGNKSIKYLDWGVKLWNDGKIEIDESDFNELYKLIDESKMFNVLVQGQVIKALNKLK